MSARRLGSFHQSVSPLGFGAFKIGRNQKTKYAAAYDLPDMQAVERLLNGVLDCGINYIDTAPAYGLSEERIGATIAHRRGEYFLSTKVGEVFDNGESTYDFSSAAIEHSVHNSLRRLRTEHLDAVFLHSPGDDLAILERTDAVPTLLRLREQGLVRMIGLSGKTVAGAQAALAWADVLMVEYHLLDRSHETIIAEAAEQGVGIVVKKPLASGKLAPCEAIRFITSNPGIATMVVGSLCLDHLQANLACTT